MTIKPMIFLTATAFVLALGSTAFAQGSSEKAPGQLMQEKGSVKGSPGASGYAPGQRMQEKGSVKGTTGASGYAPGHETTGVKSDSDAKLKAKK